MKTRLVMVSMLAILAGCNSADNVGGGDVQQVQAVPDGSKEFGLAEAIAPSPTDAVSFDLASDAEASAQKLDVAAEVAPTLPLPQQRIAYSYRVGYELDADEIGAAQAAHMALCDKLGAAGCRIKSMERGSDSGDFASASLKLAVDARVARRFQSDLDKAVDAAGGSLASRGITAEDLAKQMVDAGARIKAKQALADRLLGIIKSRNGSVADLVEAERAYAEAQEELEAARSWMAEMQTRVSLSDVDIRYTSVGPVGSGWLRPVGLAFREAGTILGESMAALIRFVVVVLPWILGLCGLVWLWRKRGWRAPWPQRWRRKPSPTPDHPA